jgi:hypothetical protein
MIPPEHNHGLLRRASQVKGKENPMLKRMSLVLAATLCALAVGFHGPAAHAAGTPGVIAKGQAAADPGVLVWIDTDKGTGLDSKSAQAVHDQFAGTEWAILDNGTMTVSKGGKVILTTAWVSNKAVTFVPLHVRSGSLTIDGTIYRDDNDPSQGFGELYINQLASDGKSARSLRIGVNLSFAAPNNNGGNDGGFGSF